MVFGIIMAVIWVLTIVGWIIFNLYRKNVRLEQTVINQATFITALQQMISESDKAVKSLDDKIWLESDKELQVVYHNLKAIQEGLNQFNK